ncbi:hypothetical protein M9Q32_29995 [Bradyrhizobium denitrificans]|uniref:hypothetical protein n=1 Tax=Bradyrhizobium sp. TaxID=376 RepID=UPI0020237E76|nr:hypothetical protein [Bradyrhizobium denitrificans]
MTVTGFGFLVERFDLLLGAAEVAASGTSHRHGYDSVSVTAIFAIILGTSIVALAAVRFRRIPADIDSEDDRKNVGSGLDFTLAGLMGMMAVWLLVYLTRVIAAV